MVFHLFPVSRFDRASWWLVGAAAIVNAAVWTALLTLVPRGGTFVPLHYTIYFRINLVGSWPKIFLLPGLGLAILLANVIISRYGDQVWRRTWLILTVVMEVLLAGAASTLIYVIRRGL